MSLIDYLPGVEIAKNYIAGIAIVTVAGIVAWHVHIEHADAAQIVTLKAELDAATGEIKAESAASKTAQMAENAEVARDDAAMKENANETQRLATKSRDAAIATAGIVDSVRRVAARVAARAPDYCPMPGAAASAGDSPTDRLSRVFGFCAQAIAGVAEHTDGAIIRGLGASADYDALGLTKPASAP